MVRSLRYEQTNNTKPQISQDNHLRCLMITDWPLPNNIYCFCLCLSMSTSLLTWIWRCFHSINCNNDIAFRYLLCWGWERTCTLFCVLCTRLTEYGRTRWHVLVMSSAITDNCVHLWLDSRQCNYISTYRHTVTVCRLSHLSNKHDIEPHETRNIC